MPTVITTIGAANANSYVSVAEGDTYHTERLHSATWTDADTTSKESAVIWATRILDNGMEWNGVKYQLDQGLRWPRSGAYDRDGDFFEVTELPNDLKDATAELARLLIASDRGADPGTKGFEQIKVGSIVLDIDKADLPDIIPNSVYMLISHLGTRRGIASSSGSSTIQLARV